MTKSKQYHLNYKIISVGETRIPIIECDVNSSGTSLNIELASFMDKGGKDFTQDMIDIPTHKIINIHPSPLPKYRGATPGPWQIINGETTSAVTFFKIDALPDHGPIITQIPLKITPTETAATFYQKAFLQ